jgi:hemolysin III
MASAVMSPVSTRPKKDYTLGEEIFNAVTHGVGALLAIAAIPLCVVRLVCDGAGMLLAAALIYSITMLVEYLMSTLYHALAAPRAKKVFKVLDHCGIYLYIAGTYTPFCLVTLIDNNGIALCIFVWAVTLAGIVAEAFWVDRPRWISAVLYLLQGWAVIVCIPALWALLDPVGFWLLVVGGLCYTIGAAFYVFTRKKKYMHSVFHLWVLAGSVFQFFSIYLFIL